MALAPEIRAALNDIVGADHVCLDVAVRRAHGSWLTDLFYVVPDAVVFPARTGEVSDLMRGAAACGLPIVHRSAETGAAAAVLLDVGGIALSLKRMNRIIDVDLNSSVARIQPHVTAEQLRSTTGLDLTQPTQPDSGVPGGVVLGVEAVLPSGAIVRTGGGLLARALGDPDQAALLARPDGTLAVITELTLCLDPSPAQPSVTLASFPTVATACTAARTVMISEEIPTQVNFLARRAIGVLDDTALLGLRRDAQALLLFTVAHRSAESRAWLTQVSRICEDAGALATRVCDDPTEATALLRAATQNTTTARSDAGLVPTTGPLAAPDRVASGVWFR